MANLKRKNKMIEILKITHFLALMFGAAASLGNLYIMMAKGPHDCPRPASPISCVSYSA